jgi:hypothetical protein
MVKADKKRAPDGKGKGAAKDSSEGRAGTSHANSKKMVMISGTQALARKSPDGACTHHNLIRILHRRLRVNLREQVRA